MLKRLMALLTAMVLLLGCTYAVQAEITKTLRRGAKGSDVRELQDMLQGLGFYTKAIDGIYGKGTVTAVKAFQREAGLKADGIAGPKTLAKLYENAEPAAEAPDEPGIEPEKETPQEPEPAAEPVYTVLASGARGEAVRKLQTALKARGYYTKKLDGIYGKGTAAAVEAFQRSAGLAGNGIADSLTQRLLYGAQPGEAPQEQPAEQAQEVQPEQPEAPADEQAAEQPALTGAEPEGEAEEQPEELPEEQQEEPQEQAPEQMAAVSSLRMGNHGDAVAEMKTKLHYIGYYTGSLDGEFDVNTRSAVTAFQKARGLSQDGVAGKKTLTAIEEAWVSAKQEAGSLPDEAVAMLNTMIVDSGAVCGTVVLSKDGEDFLTWSFGSVHEDTCFRIASVTKWVTAIGLMTLYDQGMLDLDADISEYLPFTVRNPAWPDTPITARMLLSHTSSLSPNADDYHPTWSKIGINGYDPVFDESVQPGTKYAYADYNGALFGCLIEAITGESVQNYMNRTVFEPLGLAAAYSPKLLPAGTSTMDLLNTKGRIQISVDYDRKRAFNNKADPAGNNGYTVGRLFINASSLTKLAQMMLGCGELNGVRILNADTVALMEEDQPGLAESKYGLSTVRHTQFPGGTWYGHQGRYSGLTSNIYYQRETGITVAVIMDGYDFQLEDNIVLPAVTLLKNMETLDAICNGES